MSSSLPLIYRGFDDVTEEEGSVVENNTVDILRAKLVAKKLHQAADKFEEIKALLREVETLLVNEPYEETRVHETKELERLRGALRYLSTPLQQQANNWDDYADARARG